MKNIRLFFLAVLCLTNTPAFAWHEAGHMLTALVAYDQLDPATRQRLVDILKKHPRFAEDFKPFMPTALTADDQGRWLFCQASIWPDLVRKFGDGSIPAEPAKKTSYHRSQWHFINSPFALLPPGASPAQVKAMENSAAQHLNLATSTPAQEIHRMNVLQAIDFNTAILKDTARAPEDRAVAICWIMHTVGDVHQPLHATALFTQNMFPPGSTNPEGDRGGNRISFGTAKASNLHSLWDDAPGSDHTFPVVLSRAQTLLQNSTLTAKGTAAAQNTTPSDWASESFSFAKAQAYTRPLQTQILFADAHGSDPDTDQIVALPAGYADAAGTLSDQRVVEGGFRLAVRLRASCP
jgi:hypothetical protein